MTKTERTEHSIEIYQTQLDVKIAMKKLAEADTEYAHGYTDCINNDITFFQNAILSLTTELKEVA